MIVMVYVASSVCLMRYRLAAIGATLAGFALQIVALRFRPLALVEPIAGIVVLARHAPAVTRQLQEAGDPSPGSAARVRRRG